MGVTMLHRNYIAGVALAFAGALPFHAAAQAQNAPSSLVSGTHGSLLPRPSIRFAVSISSLVSALSQSGLDIRADRLQMAVPVSATTSDPALQIAAAELRQDASLLLRITCRNAGECLPFYATVLMSDRLEAVAALTRLRPEASSPAAQRALGVTVGAHILLQLDDERMHIRIPAIAIDAGKPGSEIRVASLDRKHTYHGVVADPSTVKGGLQ